MQEHLAVYKYICYSTKKYMLKSSICEFDFFFFLICLFILKQTLAHASFHCLSSYRDTSRMLANQKSFYGKILKSLTLTFVHHMH